MQLSEDDDEDGVGGAHETSISYLTRDNLQYQNSNRKLGSNFTRKTAAQQEVQSQRTSPTPCAGEKQALQKQSSSLMD